MNLFALSGLILGATCLSLAFIVGIYGKKRLHRVWIYFNLSIAAWGFGAFIVGQATYPASAIFAWKLAHIGIIFIPICFFHTICVFAEIETKRRKSIIFAYLQGLLFLFLNLAGLLTTQVRFVFNSFYYNQSAGFLYPLFVIAWISLVILGIYELVLYYLRSSGIKKKQSLYLLVGMLVGFSGGITNFLPEFEIDIYPFGNFTIPIYCLISTYAILRHRLMDIYIAMKRTAAYSLSAGLLMGLFVVLVLAVTNLLSTFANVSSFRISIFAAVLIAFLFNPLRNWIQNLIDKIFYKKSYDYYSIIQQVSSTLASMFELEKIYQFTGDVIYDSMGLKNVNLLVGLPGGAFDIVYHTSPKKDRNIIDRSGSEKPEEMKMNKFTGILKYLKASDSILVKDELRGYEESLGQEAIDRIKKELEIFQGEAVVPVFIDKKLSLLIILGQKHSGDMFTSEDMDLLKTISNQTAIALKNVRLYQEKVNSEKLASLGMMSGTFAHEIRNPLTSLKTFAQLMPEKYNDPEFRDTFSRIVISDIQKIDGLISDLLDFSTERKSTRMNNFNLIELVDGVVDYVESKLEFERSKITIEKNYNEQEINMMGDTEKYKQALGNIVMNGCQAMHGEGILRIGIKPNGKNVEIAVEDTGEGINPEDLPKIFDPFVTTKKMGIGLGLAISKRIIEDYSGKIYVKSQPAQGTTFTISLPVQNQ